MKHAVRFIVSCVRGAAAALCVTICVTAAVTTASCASAPPAAARQGGAEAGAAAMSLQEAITRAALEIAGKLPAGAELAVVAFASESTNLSEYLMEELDYALVDQGLVVADRAMLNSVRKELDFQASQEVDEKTAQAIGHFLGVPYEALGTFQSVGEVYRFAVTVTGVETAVRAAEVRLNVRDDESLRKTIAALKRNMLTTHSAAY